jgi:subtilisin family serine protease
MRRPAPYPAALLGTLLLSAAIGSPTRAGYTSDPASRKVSRTLLAEPLMTRATAGARVSEPWRDGSRVHVYVRVTATDTATIDALRAHGLEIVVVSDAFGGLVDGWADVSSLRGLAELPAVTMIRPVARPIGQAGAVVTEGDALLHADAVRASGFTGAGVVLGLISDGLDSLQASQAAGELPAVTVPPDPRCVPPAGDEGTAMLEIVHDVAPGASLLFGSSGGSGAQMAETVRCLAASGARVIVDDITIPDEPFYQDGPLALAAREVVQGGVSYHTSAGNRRREFIEQQLAPVFVGAPFPSGLVHDFDAAGDGDTNNSILLGPGGATCVLQWDEPFGAAATDLDLFVFDADFQLLGSSEDPQDGTQDPIEAIDFNNPGDDPVVLRLVVSFFDGDPQRLFRLMCFRTFEMERVSLEGAIYGQQSVPEVIAVASIDVKDPGLDTVEPDSSPGPAKVFFPSPQVREKPDIASFDGVRTTVPGFDPFFGTSAAAPHSGAVAALMLSKNPSLTPAQIQQIMKATAIDIEAPGFDHFAGPGRLDAVAALAGVPCIAGESLPETLSCTGEKIPKGAAATYRKARRRLIAAASASPAKVKKLLRPLRKPLDKAANAITTRQSEGKLTAGCAESLRNLLSRVANGVSCRLSG